MTVDAETPLRADARRNRDQIVAAAKTIFAEQGPDVPMEEIARAARVGVGTLYRRFSDRHALIRGIARESFATVLAEARTAIAEEPTAWDVLVRFLRQSQELRLSFQLAMMSREAATVIHDDPVIGEFRQALLGELEKVVHAAQAEGTLRQDVDTGDVAIIFWLLTRQITARHEAAARLAPARCLVLMLDGLRARPGSPLPGRPITTEDLAR